MSPCRRRPVTRVGARATRYTGPMRDINRGFRLLALSLVAVLTLTLAAPAPAEALEPLTLVALASLAVVGVIIIVFLVVANVSQSRSAAESEPRYVACAESDTAPRACWAVSDMSAVIPAAAIPQGG